MADEGATSSAPAADGAPRPALATMAARLAQGAISLLGLGTILYGIGFLVVRAQHDFTGVWSGVDWRPAEIAEEGGRFLFHLLYLPASIISPVSWPIVIVAVAFGVWRTLRPHAGASSSGRSGRASLTDRAAALVLRSPSLVIVGIVLLTALLLETVWVASTPRAMLYGPTPESAKFGEAPYRMAIYHSVVIRILVALAGSWLLLRVFWRDARTPERVLILVQWLLVVAALGLWPVVYGKLVALPSYPVVSHQPPRDGDSRVLLHQGDQGIVAWNSTRRSVELLPKLDKDALVIGPRRAFPY